MDIVAGLPKAELHLHLEGSVEPETVHELDPSVSVEEARGRYAYTSFGDFLAAFKWVSSLLKTPEDYALVTRRLIERLAAQNVAYAEITLSAGVVLWKKQDLSAVWPAVRDASSGGPVEVRWIFDAIRHFGAAHGQEVASAAVQYAPDGVVAFGIGGDEERGPARWFGDVFAFARSRGLHTIAHAGETTNARSVWEALAIGAERIGHGIRAIDDAALVRELADRGVPLEICPTSNVATGAVRSFREHPLRALSDAGVEVTIHTDDPAMFRTTLTREFEIARDEFDFNDNLLRKTIDAAFRHAFSRVIDLP